MNVDATLLKTLKYSTKSSWVRERVARMRSRPRQKYKTDREQPKGKKYHSKYYEQ